MSEPGFLLNDCVGRAVSVAVYNSVFKYVRMPVNNYVYVSAEIVVRHSLCDYLHESLRRLGNSVMTKTEEIVSNE